jgi:phosphate uptake regulator
MSHFEERLEEDLNHIRDWVWSLGERVEDALRAAKKLLVVPDEDMCYAIVLGDYPINRDSRECDRLCHTFIARHLPGAGHLREMASTIRVNVALERLGDYAVTISRAAHQLSGPLPKQLAQDMDALADETLSILHQSRVAYREANAEQAISLMQMARLVEGRMDHRYDALAAADDELDGHSMLIIYVAFSLFKRVADQAKNICDQTVYAVSGVAKIPKVHKVLFLDQPDSGLGQLATAIGRKNFADAAVFNCATPGRADPLSDELREFLGQRGLADDHLTTERLEALKHDIGDYGLLVSLSGHYHDYVPTIPFHSSALNWTVDDDGAPGDRTAQYRALRSQIESLMSLVVGEKAGGD